MLNRNNLPQTFLNLIPVGLAFLMPVFFLPTTTEFYEFNKLTLLMVATLIMLVAWAARMLLDKSVKINKSMIDFPMLILLAIFILSTIFSIDRFSSIFGSQGRWFPSLTGLVSLIAFYYTISTNVDNMKMIKYTLLGFAAGSTISTIVALLGYYGVVLGSSPYLASGNFTLTGSPVTAGILAALATVIALSMLMYSNNMPVRTVLVQLVVVNLFGALILGGLPGWAVLATGVFGTLFLIPALREQRNKTFVLAISGAAAAIIIALIIPTTRSVLINGDYPNEIKLSAQPTWVVVSSTLRDFPLLGSGPSTFYLNFPRYKPLTLNNTDLWNVRFDKGYSEALSLIGSVGVLGIAAAAFFAIKVLKYAFAAGRSLQHEGENGGVVAILGMGVMSIVVALVFTYATVMAMFVLFLFLGMLTAAMGMHPQTRLAEKVGLSLSSLSMAPTSSVVGGYEQSRKETFQYVAVIPMFALVIAGGYYNSRVYAAEYYMRESIKAALENNGGRTYEMQGLALNLVPQRDTYHNTYAQTNIAIASNIAARENLSDEDRDTIQQLISQAIRNVRISTEVVNPLNAASWEVRGSVYRALTGVAEDADVWAVNAYNTAIQLDPTSPRLRVDLGGIYFGQQDYLSAGNLFRQAVSLKGDYANGRYNFAQALVMLEAYEDASRELEAVQRLLDVGSPDYERVGQDIATLKSLPAVAGTEDERPSVAELESQAGEEEVTPQEPLSQPGQDEVVNPELDLNEGQ